MHRGKNVKLRNKVIGKGVRIWGVGPGVGLGKGGGGRTSVLS